MRVNPRVFVKVAVVSVVVTVAAIVWQFRASLFVHFLGPPSVTLTEAYKEKTNGPQFDHSGLNTLLVRHVDEHGWVDYNGLQSDSEELAAYVDSLGRAPFDELGRSEKLALLINAYNAFTLSLIVEHYPLSSIRDIPSSRRWDDVRWNVGGNKWSLSQIEHEQIRPKFSEPGVHFALVCAAVGCPPLRNEAFLSERLEEQLRDQLKYVHRHSTWFKFDAEQGVVYLTPLYNWYRDDFRQVDGTVLKYAASFSPKLQQALSNNESPRLVWLDYDWKLNSKQNRTSR